MEPISFEEVLSACRPGGASVLTSVTRLMPAGGPHAAISPPTYLSGSTPVYAFEQRFNEGRAEDAVVVESKSSSLNRVEAALAIAIDEGVEILARMPRIRVVYKDEEYSDLTLPHRAFDAHIRAGATASGPVTADPVYRSARNSTPADARGLLELSPVSLVFGSWDSSRKSHQVRQRSCLTGEIIGFLADQTGATVSAPPRRGGARVDPVGMQIEQDAAGAGKVLDALGPELSPKLVAKVRDEFKRAKEPRSMSRLGFGGIPPTLDSLGGVAVKELWRTHVLSFAALRQLRFGAGPDGDAACRTVLAALALDGLARSDAELNLRANCDLVEAEPAQVTLDQRYGEKRELRALTIEEGDDLLSTAVRHAEEVAGLRWEGVALEVTGNAEILKGIADEGDSE